MEAHKRRYLLMPGCLNPQDTRLLPLQAIADKLPFTLRDDARNFLLVTRFDRDAPTPNGRLHMEDFAQALSIKPEAKYRADYFSIGAVLLEVSAAADDDIIELLRRIKVNELLGNYDAHAKNFSLLYGLDGYPRLSPAYDIVAYSAYISGRGHALRFFPDGPAKQMLTPKLLRMLANAWDIAEARLRKALQDTVASAVAQWPALIDASLLTGAQKQRLEEQFERHPDVQSLRRRQQVA
jgi:serine/threonine-protein kinase HipA